MVTGIIAIIGMTVVAVVEAETAGAVEVVVVTGGLVAVVETEGPEGVVVAGKVVARNFITEKII